MSGAEQVEVRSVEEWRAWLEQNHAKSASIWLVTYKAVHPDKHVGYPALVEEAIAFGWIDSLPRALDADRSMRRFSPRKPGSAWSKVNKAIAERLIAEGRMRPAGLAAVAAAQENGGWSKLDAVETLETPADLASALDARPPARRHFEAFPRSAKRAILEWIGSAKAEVTRAKRIAETAEAAQKGIRANQYRQPKGR